MQTSPPGLLLRFDLEQVFQVFRASFGTILAPDVNEILTPNQHPLGNGRFQ